MQRLDEHQDVTLSVPGDGGPVDLPARVVTVDGGEALLYVPDDALGVSGSAGITMGCYMTFLHHNRPIALHGYVRRAEWSTLRFGVDDGVSIRPRRQAARLPVAIPVEMVAEDSPGTTIKGVTQNVGAGGVAIGCDGLPASAVYTVRFCLEENFCISAECEVVGRRPGAVSMKWSHLDHASGTQLAAYVLERKLFETRRS